MPMSTSSKVTDAGQPALTREATPQRAHSTRRLQTRRRKLAARLRSVGLNVASKSNLANDPNFYGTNRQHILRVIHFPENVVIHPREK